MAMETSLGGHIATNSKTAGFGALSDFSLLRSRLLWKPGGCGFPNWTKPRGQILVQARQSANSSLLRPQEITTSHNSFLATADKPSRNLFAISEDFPASTVT
jgi:hypothetical protein